MKACIKGGSSIVKLLLEHNADPTARSKAGGTPLSALMMQVNDAAEAISTTNMLDNGTDPDTLQASGHYTLFGETSGFDVITKRASIGLTHVPGQEEIEAVMRMSQADSKLRLLVEANVDPNQAIVDTHRDGRKRAAHGYSPLLLTATTCNDSMLKLLLKLGADPNFRCEEDGMTPLLVKACIERFQAGVQILLDSKADPNLQTDIVGMKGANALAIAVAMGIHGNVKCLLDAGAAPNSLARTTGEKIHAGGCEAMSATVLTVAAGNHDHEVARLLLSKKADPNLQFADGYCPLAAAINSTRPERLATIGLLLRHKADPNTHIGGWTPLCCSTKQQGDASDVMQVLLQHNADPNVVCQATKGRWGAARDGSQMPQPVVSPLLLASSLGLSECVRALLEAKADPNQVKAPSGDDAKQAEQGDRAAARPLEGCTALMIAGSDDCANLLLSYGADPAKTAADQSHALMGLVGNGCSSALHSVLGSQRLDPNAKAARGVTALMVAAEREDGDSAVRRLLAADADPDAPAENGCTALMIAASNGSEGVVRALLEGKANPSLAAQDGSNALHYAAERAGPSVCKLLLDAQADPDARDGEGWSALMKAMLQNSKENLHALLDAKADPAAEDKEGRTALDVATAEGCDHTVLDVLHALKLEPATEPKE